MTVTNYGKIREMSLEEMADFIASVTVDAIEAEGGNTGLLCRQWLEKGEAEGENTAPKPMSLEETGREYVRQAQELFREAEKVEAGMRMAKSGRELFRMREQREKLTEIARDMRITGESLIHYYDR